MAEINLPDQLPTDWAKEILAESVPESAVLRVADVKPQTTALTTSRFKMTGKLKAQVRGVSEARKGSDVQFTVVEAPVRELTVVYRFPKELAKIDEEINGGLLDKATEDAYAAIGTGVDKLVMAGKDGFDVSVADAVFLDQTSKSVEVIDSNYDDALEAGIALLVAKGFPKAAILDWMFAYGTSTEKNVNDLKKNDVDISAATFNLKGMKTAASENVATAAADRKGYLFDPKVVQVALGTNIGTTYQTIGDPDNTGVPLDGVGQHAIVFEVPVSTHVWDLTRVVKIVDAVAE